MKAVHTTVATLIALAGGKVEVQTDTASQIFDSLSAAEQFCFDSLHADGVWSRKGTHGQLIASQMHDSDHGQNNSHVIAYVQAQTVAQPVSQKKARVFVVGSMHSGLGKITHAGVLHHTTQVDGKPYRLYQPACSRIRQFDKHLTYLLPTMEHEAVAVTCKRCLAKLRDTDTLTRMVN